MEASDAFTQEIGTEDPFAGSDFGDFKPEQDTRPTDAQPAAEIPVVDREGQRIDGGANHQPADAASVETKAEPAAPAPSGPPTLTPEERAAEAARYREEKGEPEPTPDEAQQQQARLRAIAEREAAEKAAAAQAEAQAAEVPQDRAEAVQEAARATEEVVAGDQGDPTPISSSPQPTEPTSDAPSGEPSSESAGGEDEDAPPPEEPKDASGKATRRRYLILQVTGPGKFEQVSWYEDKDGKMVPRGAGAKRQTVALARGTEEALKIGFAALGAPNSGAHLVPVAQLHFQPKRIKPKPPEPARMRLEIS